VNYNFLGGIAQTFCGIKKWSCPPAGGLGFWFFFAKQKEQKN
jgi:hypothetical protein